jgi:hypothetical protein
VLVSLGFLQHRNPADINLIPGIIVNGYVQWGSKALANLSFANVSRKYSSFTHDIYRQQRDDTTREYATLVKVQYDSNPNHDHWVGVKGITSFEGKDYIVIAPTSRNDLNVAGNNSLRREQGWLSADGNILVPVEKTNGYVTFSRNIE